MADEPKFFEFCSEDITNIVVRVKKLEEEGTGLRNNVARLETEVDKLNKKVDELLKRIKDLEEENKSFREALGLSTGIEDTGEMPVDVVAGANDTLSYEELLEKYDELEVENILLKDSMRQRHLDSE